MNRVTFVSCLLLAMLTSHCDKVKAQATIDQRFNFHCENQSLDSMLNAVSKHFRVPLVIDYGELQKSKIELEELRVSCALTNATFHEITEALLRPHHLICIDRHGCLLVTTHEAATVRYFDTRVYQLRKRMKVERRMQTIMWSASPKSWLLTGGKGDAAAFSSDKILIYQSAANHIEITDMFQKSVVPVDGKVMHQFHPASDLEHTLAKPATLNFRGKTLAEVATSIKETQNFAITLATDELKSKIVNTNIGAAPSFNDGLSLLLELIDPSITWIVKDDFISITTSDTAAIELQEVTYRLPKAISPAEIGQLIDAIEYTIATDCWETVGGDASINRSDENRHLAIKASHPVHRQIRQLLADLQGGH